MILEKIIINEDDTTKINYDNEFINAEGSNTDLMPSRKLLWVDWEDRTAKDKVDHFIGYLSKSKIDGLTNDIIKTKNHTYYVIKQDDITNVSSEQALNTIAIGGSDILNILTDLDDYKRRNNKKEELIKFKTKLIMASEIYREGTRFYAQEQVIRKFLKEKIDNGDFKEDVYNLVPTLRYIFLEYGFKNRNYFLSFLKTYYSKNDKFSEKGLGVIFNLYENRVIYDEDLRATTSDGSNAIIFNESLYKYPERDIEFIIKAFEWMSDEYNWQTKTNNNELLKTKYGIKTIFSQFTPSTSKKLRNKITFKDGNVNGEVNDRDFIGDSMDELQIMQSSRKRRNNNVRVNRNREVKNNREWNDFISDNLRTKEDVQNFLAYIQKFNVAQGDA